MTEEIDVLETDVLVVGAGMGGLTAASYLAEQGKSVLVVEKGSEIGGTSAVSGGVLWTAPDTEAWRRRCPRGEEALGEALIGGFPRLLGWLQTLNVEFERHTVTVHGFAQGRPFDILGYFDRATRLIESRGGWVMRSTEVLELLKDQDAVVGAIVRDDQGTSVQVRCAAVILATGGFQGSAQARATYIHPNASKALVRANPNSVGDGLDLARRAGGDVNAVSDGFYGHLICAPISDLSGEDFTRLYMHFSHLVPMLNLEGVRFTDERAGDHHNAQALVRQPDGRGLLVFDNPLYETAVLAPNVEGFQPYDKLELARARGANVASAATVEELATLVEDWGFNREGIIDEIEAHNRRGGPAQKTDQPLRVSTQPKVTEAPFYAIEVQPGVTFGHAGIKIDSNSRVLGQDGRAMAGLYACGADVGGVYDHGYCGGLALAGVFGLVAARHISG